jgi:hypothetical protein
MKIIYTHIEKTAGTSFRVYLRSMFPANSFFWFSNTKESFPSENFFLYGGHRGAYQFDKYFQDSVMLSILRSPIERIRSLHRYLTKVIMKRSADISQDHYCLSGFDPYSIKRSLLNCDDFRIRCHNMQALNFCPEFSDPNSNLLGEQAYDYIVTRPSIIGIQENLTWFLNRLINRWSWSSIFPSENVTKLQNSLTTEVHPNIEDEFIRSFCDQDIILYDKLSKNFGLDNLTTAQAKSVSSEIPYFIKKENLINIRIRKDGEQIIHLLPQTLDSKQLNVEVEFAIHNRNPNDFNIGGEFTTNLSYHVKQENGNIIIFDGKRTPFTSSIGSNKENLYNVSISIPNSPGRYLIEPSLVIENTSWIDSENGASTEPFMIIVEKEGNVLV